VQAQAAPLFSGGAPGAQRAAAAGHAEDNAAVGGDTPGHAGRAGHRPGALIDSEVISGEPACHGCLDRPGLDHRGVPGLADLRAQVPAAVGGIAVPFTRRPATGHLTGQELGSDRGVAVVLPGSPGQLLPGDDPGLRAGHHVRAVPVAAVLRGLAGMPRLRVMHRDHPVPGHLAGDPPPPIGPVTALRRLDILPGDQR